MNYDLMLDFVYNTLKDADALKSPNPLHYFRNRFDHTKRVLGWCKRIHTDLEVDEEILYTAAIFHDVGYAKGKGAHAHSSAEIWILYAKNHDIDYEFTMNVANCVAIHSDKHLIGSQELSNEALLLMEADLLDEEGALGFVWDFMAIGAMGNTSYYDSIDACKHSEHILNQDYMITPLAKKYWEEKKEFVRKFVAELKSDLFVGE